MTKQEEIDEIRAFVQRLGEDSYCGPWLYSQLPFIESAIRSDVNPGMAAMSLQEFREARDAVMEKAKMDAVAVVEKATEGAKAIIATADRYRDGCIEAVSKALYELRK